MFIRSNEETSLSDDFSELLFEKNIIFEPAIPDTQEQNGHAEQKGEILIMKARALQIDVELPHYL